MLHLSYKLPDVLSQKLWFLKGGKVPTTGHIGIGDNVLKQLLCPGPRGMGEFIREGRNTSGNINRNPVDKDIAYESFLGHYEKHLS